MRFRKGAGALVALLVAAAAAYQSGGIEGVLRMLPGALEQGAPRPEAGAPAQGAFDYYVLTLSWSPSYCEAEGDARDSAQCEGGRPYGFVVHGLWPQNETGWPEFCDVRARVPDDVTRAMLPIMPARGLIYHQWKKHGTCSGLDPRGYFETTRAAFDSIAIPEPFTALDKAITVAPDVVEQAFREANPGLDADEIVISCAQRRLREVRICLDKDLTPRRCGADVLRDCRDRSVRMPPLRGG